MQDITKDPQFAFANAARRAKAREALDRALDCTLKCQVVTNGELTVWPQQCDPVTLKPTKARSFELESISGGESAGIVLFLMTLDDPVPEVRHAIRSAVAWYERSKVLGKRIEKKPDPTLPHGNDVYLVDDPNAPPLWGRFYDLQTNQVFFCGRDSVKKSSLDQIEAERRAGYVWLAPYGKAVLEQYKSWSARYGGSDANSK
jgi:PelA/Pel-15E family pectate lyase